MCEQGYVAIGNGNAETRCTLVPDDSGHESSASSSIVFPGRIRRTNNVDFEHHLITLENARHDLRINSKRLYAIDADEETETNANSATGVNRFDGEVDKRKSSRKHDDFMFYETDNVMGRFGGGHDEKETAATTSKHYRADKSDEVRAVRWWPPVTLNCQSEFNKQFPFEQNNNFKYL